MGVIEWYEYSSERVAAGLGSRVPHLFSLLIGPFKQVFNLSTQGLCSADIHFPPLPRPSSSLQHHLLIHFNKPPSAKVPIKSDFSPGHWADVGLVSKSPLTHPLSLSLCFPDKAMRGCRRS